MQNFQDIFETRERSFISAFSICMTAPLTITTHVLPNISQSKENQTMKFGQVIQYNKRNIFLKRLCRK